MIPTVTFELSTAIMVSVIWGLCMLTILNYTIAKDKPENTWKIIIEHLAIALIVVIVIHYAGDRITETYS